MSRGCVGEGVEYFVDWGDYLKRLEKGWAIEGLGLDGRWAKVVWPGGFVLVLDLVYGFWSGLFV